MTSEEFRWMSQWSQRLPDNRLAWAQALAMATKNLHQYPFKARAYLGFLPGVGAL